MKNSLPNRLLAFLAVETYGKSPFNRVSAGPYGEGVYLQANPYNCSKGLNSPAELIVYMINYVPGEVFARKGLVVVSNIENIKEIARVPYEKIDLKAPLGPQIQGFLPKAIQMHQLEKDLKGKLSSIISKRRKKKYKRVQLPLRTRLDYGVPR